MASPPPPITSSADTPKISHTRLMKSGSMPLSHPSTGDFSISANPVGTLSHNKPQKTPHLDAVQARGKPARAD